MFFCVFGGECAMVRVCAGGSAAAAISGATSDDLVETMVRVWAGAVRRVREREERGRGAVRGECESGSDLRVVRARHRRTTANFKFKIAAQECGQRRMNAAVRGYEQRH